MPGPEHIALSVLAKKGIGWLSKHLQSDVRKALVRAVSRALREDASLSSKCTATPRVAKRLVDRLTMWFAVLSVWTTVLSSGTGCGPPGARWHVIAVADVSSPVLEKDAPLHPEESLAKAFARAASLAASSARPGVLDIAYCPENGGLTVASLTLDSSLRERQLAMSRLEPKVLFPADGEGFACDGVAIAAAEDAGVFAYVHPWRREMVTYEPGEGRIEGRPLPCSFQEEGSLGIALDASLAGVAASPDGSHKYAAFSAYERPGMTVLCQFSEEMGDWRVDEVWSDVLLYPQIVPSLEGSVHVFGTDLAALWHLERRDGVWAGEAVAHEGWWEGGDYAALADSQGGLHVFCHGVGRDRQHVLRHVWRAGGGGAWRTEDVYVVGKSARRAEDVVLHMCPSAAADDQGGLHVSFFDFRSGEVKYAWHAGGAWHVERVAQCRSAARTCVVVSQHLVHVAFIDAWQRKLLVGVRGAQ